MGKFNKVLIVINDLNQGGAETQSLNLAVGLKERGHQVEVLSFGNKKGVFFDKFQKNNIAVSKTGFREKLLLPPFRGIKNKLLYLRYKLKLILQLKRINPDVVIPFTYAPNLILSDCKKWVNYFVFWNQRDEGRMFSGSRKEIVALKICDHIISNSTTGKLFLEKFTDRPVDLIFNGISVESFAFDKAQLEDTSIIKVVMVANLHPFKDHITLLKAWKIVLQRMPFRKLQLVFAGRFGSTGEAIRNFIESNNLTDTVLLKGPVTHIPELLKNSSIGVLSSHNEGMPNVILEYMAAGLPVVATRIPGTEDILGKEYPFLAEPGNHEEFADHLFNLIETPNIARKWSERNKNRVETMFTIDQMVEKYRRLFQV